jgi:hypothetical protein
VRDAGRQADGAEVLLDTRGRARWTEPTLLREARGLRHADGDGLAVQEAARIASPGFERVTEGVAEVQEHAIAGLGLVPLDDARLGGDRDFDGFGKRCRIIAEKALPILLQPAEEAGVAQQAVLRHLGIARTHLANGKRGERLRVGEHKARLMERADQVFALGRVDAGLAADAAVDLREKAVGICTKRTPRRRIAAAKPARSPMTPPPSAMTRSPRSSFSASRPSLRRPSSAKHFVASPAA